MLSNTGTVSFWLYLFIVFIGLFSLIFLYRLIKKGELGQENLDKFIDYFKWVVVSLAISTVTLIVSDLFKERDQDIKELEYFDKYVNDVKEQKDPLVRLQLAKYLSVVAPSGDMKRSWTNYYNEVKKEYDDYLKAQENIKSDTLTNPTRAQMKKIEESQKKIELFETPLSSTEPGLEWFIIAGGDPKIEDADDELKKAVKINQNSTIIKKGNSFRTVLMGYTSKAEAQNQLLEARRQINKTAYIVKKSSWCNSYQQTQECLVCK
ncbi:SPOR domain-containing protein [Flavobacterium sp. LHD-85]|uniref:SPOR domain-containing protein n=1 Tax=Flavobacterium sp. LHD-85 TaxID=3071410 RepID=UPI0027DEF270|nr:SPOR domain-containing protein [Flavobacterium sp. LHD-85]MDQ6528341.1 SPOR domain-containing protein [Flavobacterium sp. LHD-85]